MRSGIFLIFNFAFLLSFSKSPPEIYFPSLCFHTSTHLLHPPIHRHLNCCGSNKKRWKQILLPPTQNAIVLP
ncbi:hypothetical protein HMPREF2141_01374 [Bacteroides uniformis]|nr:hypothetical protein HMPREF2141_01374 [Bacteroides uniformis]